MSGVLSGVLSADPVNRGVERDEQGGTATRGVMLRRVTHTDPNSVTTYEFLPNEMTLRPDVIAQLYLMHWKIEKVFDDLKNKLRQTEAWAKSATAKEIRRQFICLAHNLIPLLEARLAGAGVGNAAEIKRRA